MVNAKVESALQLFWVKGGSVSHECLIIELSDIIGFDEVLVKSKILSHPGLKAFQIFFRNCFLAQPMLKPPLVCLSEALQIMQSYSLLMMIDCVNNVLVSFALNIGWLSYPIIKRAIRSGTLVLINGAYNVYRGEIIIIILGTLNLFKFLALMTYVFGLLALVQSMNSFNLQLLLVFH